jgi:tRNA pseudouridine13 synthase
MTKLPNWPYLTPELPPLAGRIKVQPEDFVVEEIPQYPCSGEGTHIYFAVEKTGMTTLDLLRRLSRALGRRERDFGYAGLKDSQAVTRQIMSLEHIEPERIQALSLPGVQVLWTNRHVNKLKLGHLAGNKFHIRIREIGETAEALARPCLELLAHRGVPNYFGIQRFGVRGDSWLLGRSIIKEEPKEFLDQFCGRPQPNERDMIHRAREAFDRGEYELAAEIWPGFFRDPKRACRILAGKNDAYWRAFSSVDTKLKRLFVSAYQSYLFNQLLGRRLTDLDRLLPGDLAYKHINGAVFRFEDEQAEQPRVDRFEISPTGPLFGYRMPFPQGEAGKMETELLEAEGLSLDAFRNVKGHKIKGSRRPLRVQMANVDIATSQDALGPFLNLSFELPSGSYATAVLRELMKDHLLTQSRLGGNIGD